MIDREHGLPLRRQAAVLQLSRSTFYYEPRPVSVADLAIIWRSCGGLTSCTSTTRSRAAG